jgi:hypothetical protein
LAFQGFFGLIAYPKYYATDSLYEDFPIASILGAAAAALRLARGIIPLIDYYGGSVAMQGVPCLGNPRLTRRLGRGRLDMLSLHEANPWLARQVIGSRLRDSESQPSCLRKDFSFEKGGSSHSPNRPILVRFALAQTAIALAI